MSKYEIMLLADAELKQEELMPKIDSVISLFSNLPEYKFEIIANDELAYPINKRTRAHRIILNFFLEDKLILAKMREQLALNKYLFRYLLINLEKDYGYKASINPKKIKVAQVQQEKYKKYVEMKSQRMQRLNETTEPPAREN